MGGFDEVGDRDALLFSGCGFPVLPGEAAISELLAQDHGPAFGLKEVGSREWDALLLAPEAVPGGQGCNEVEHLPAQLDGAPELPRFEAGVGRFELGHFLA